MGVLMWVGIGVAVLLVAVFVVLPITWLALFGGVPEGITLTIESPESVRPHTPFEIIVTVTNQLDRPREVRSIDFRQEILKGMAVESVDPLPDDQSSMLGTTAFHFRLPIAAKGSTNVRVRCRSLGAGQYAGVVMVYVDGKSSKCIDRTLTIEVR